MGVECPNHDWSGRDGDCPHCLREVIARQFHALRRFQHAAETPSLFAFLKPEKERGRERFWKRLAWWQRAVRWFVYGLPVRRCCWCGRPFWGGLDPWREYCSKTCCDEEIDSWR